MFRTMGADVYKLEIRETDLWIYARLGADSVQHDEEHKCVEQIAERCRETGKNKVITERCVSDTISNVHGFRLAALLIDIFPPGTSVGVVDSDPVRRSHLEWGVRAHRAQPISIKVFAATADAEAWLTSLAAVSANMISQKAGQARLPANSNYGTHQP